MNALKTLLLAALGSCLSSACAQQPWFRTYSWLGFTEGQVVLERPDSHLVLLGTVGQQSGDLFAAVLDKSGSPLDFKPFGWEGQETLNQAVWNADSSQIWAIGSTNSLNSGGYDALLVVFNPQGDTLWTKSFGSHAWELGKAIVRDQNGLFWLGIQDFSAYDQSGSLRLILLNNNGLTILDTALSSPGLEWMVEDLHMGYKNHLVIAGTYFPGLEGNRDAWTMGWNPAADTLLFENRSGIPGEEEIQTICPYINSNNQPYYLVAGNAQDHLGLWKSFYWRIDTNGVEIARIDLGQGQAIQRRNSHAFYLTPGASHATISNFYDANFGSWNTVFDSVAFLFPQLSKTFVRNGNQELNQVHTAFDGGYLLTGSTDDIGLGQRSAFVERLGPLGNGINGFVMGHGFDFIPTAALLYPNPAPTGTPRFIRGLQGNWKASWFNAAGKKLLDFNLPLEVHGSPLPEPFKTTENRLLVLQQGDITIRFLCINL